MDGLTDEEMDTRMHEYMGLTRGVRIFGSTQLIPIEAETKCPG